jgi:hypothetical protein
MNNCYWLYVKKFWIKTYKELQEYMDYLNIICISQIYYSLYIKIINMNTKLITILSIVLVHWVFTPEIFNFEIDFTFFLKRK